MLCYRFKKCIRQIAIMLLFTRSDLFIRFDYEDTTRSLLGLVKSRSARILLECFLVWIFTCDVLYV